METKQTVQNYDFTDDEIDFYLERVAIVRENNPNWTDRKCQNCAIKIILRNRNKNET